MVEVERCQTDLAYSSHLSIVLVLSLIFWGVHLIFVLNIHVIVGQYRKTGWLVWIIPLFLTTLIGVLLVGDNLILADLRKESGIEDVTPMASFWM